MRLDTLLDSIDAHSLDLQTQQQQLETELGAVRTNVSNTLNSCAGASGTQCSELLGSVNSLDTQVDYNGVRAH